MTVPRHSPVLARACVVALGLVFCGCFASNDITRAPKVAAPVSERGSIAPASLATGRLPLTARPLRYALSLVVDPVKERFLGDVTIDVDIPAATRAIVLHGRDFSVIRAEALVEGESMTAQAEFRMASGGKGTPEELVLTVPRPIAAGKAQLRISYSAPLDTRLSGLYRVEDQGSAYAFTQFEPMDARRMFPCFDEPSFKVPFDIKVTTPKGNLVFANTEEIERTDSEDSRRTTFVFATTPPLPTYLVALAIGPFEVREGAREPVKIRLITAKDKSALGELVLEAAAAQLRILGEYFARPYPYTKLDVLAVPEFGFGAMENAALVTFREDWVLLDPKSASTAARRNMAEVVAHEIAHHWFGNLVTMKWWDDLWLKEGFATWMETKAVDLWRPSMNARLEALSNKGWVMEIDALDSARAVRQPVTSLSDAEEAFDGLTYDKGAGVIEMLESWLGPDTFREGIRGYIKAHEHGVATAADLFTALSQKSGKDVSSVAATFLDQPGVPLVRAELVCEKGKDPRVLLSQTRFRTKAIADQESQKALWKIPLCIAYEGDSKTGPVCGLLDGPTGEISLKSNRCPRWIYPNAQQSGYFRFALPAAQSANLAGAFKTLDVRTRMGLVNNAWALVQSGNMGADSLLDLLQGMKQERQRLVVAQLISVLTAVSDTVIDEATRPAFQGYVSSILQPMAKELGWDAKESEDDEQRLLRKLVLMALSTLAEDSWLSVEADKRAAAYLKNPRSVDGDIAEIALRFSTRRTGEPWLKELMEALKRAPTPEDRQVLLGALGSFADPALVRRALDWIMMDRSKMQDGYGIFSAAMTWPSSRSALLSWFREHAEELRERFPSFAMVRFAGALGMICDKMVRSEAGSFFTDALKDVEGADRPLAQALEKADLCIELRTREASKVKKHLGKRKKK